MRLAPAFAAALFVAAAPALVAAPCKDAKGRFIKCPPPPAVKAGPCKGPNGKFAKCGTPAAVPLKK